MTDYLMVAGEAVLALTGAMYSNIGTTPDPAVLTLSGVGGAYRVVAPAGTATWVGSGTDGVYRTTIHAGTATLALTGTTSAWRNGFPAGTATLALTGDGIVRATLYQTGGAAVMLVGGYDGVYRTYSSLEPAVLTLSGFATFTGVFSFGAGEAILTLTGEGAVRARYPHDGPRDAVLTLTSPFPMWGANNPLPLIANLGLEAYLPYDATDAVGGWHCRTSFGGDAILRITAEFRTRATTSEGVDADTEAVTLGYRRGMSRLVYHIGVREAAETVDVPDGSAFIVSEAFVPTPGNALYDSGASPGYIGWRRGTAAQATFSFRAPYANETVWFLGDNKLRRWERTRDTANWSWKPYLSLPERAVEGVRAFEVFDPDGVYSYVARVAGAMATQLQQDNKVIAGIRDPARVPESLIPEAAKSLDTALDASSDYAKQRATLSLIVPAAKNRGLSEAVDQRLRTLGYRGWVAEVWRLIDWSSVEVSGVASVTSSRPAAVVSVSSPDGAFIVYCWRDNTPGVNTSQLLAQQQALRLETQAFALDAVGFNDLLAQVSLVITNMQAAEAALAPVDLPTANARVADAVRYCDAAVTEAKNPQLVDTDLPERIAYIAQQQLQLSRGIIDTADTDIIVASATLTKTFRISPLTLPAGYVAVDAAETANVTMTRLAAAINAAFGAGHARVVDDSWPKFIEYPHGYYALEPGAYWVSSQLNLHVNHADGTRVELTTAERKVVVRELMATVLPIHARIRNFATDVDAVPSAGDSVHVGESFEIEVL